MVADPATGRRFFALPPITDLSWSIVLRTQQHFFVETFPVERGLDLHVVVHAFVMRRRCLLRSTTAFAVLGDPDTPSLRPLLPPRLLFLFLSPYCLCSPAVFAASSKTQRRSLTASQEEVFDKLDVRLRKDVKLLGGILGRTIEKHSGGSSQIPVVKAQSVTHLDWVSRDMYKIERRSPCTIFCPLRFCPLQVRSMCQVSRSFVARFLRFSRTSILASTCLPP